MTFKWTTEFLSLSNFTERVLLYKFSVKCLGMYLICEVHKKLDNIIAILLASGQAIVLDLSASIIW